MAILGQPCCRPLHVTELSDVGAVGGLLVIHFWAPWNGADPLFNRELTPVREHFASRAVFRSVNIDEPSSLGITRWCELANVPTLVGLLEGKAIGTLVGLRPSRELGARVGPWVRRARRVIEPSWRTSDVLGMARGILDDHAFERLPILGDALMDAGCEDDRVLAACRRTNGEAWWLVDLLLGTG